MKALTGIDCDRLEEEKRRGITIELGFARLDLASGKTLSIIDVPGHERFIRQMACGAAGMDAAMLVIAASEGVMPQTREHLDILGLLGVRRGLVALTKKDLVDEETLAIAVEEAADLIDGSCLAGARVIPVSAQKGEGLEALLAEIEALAGGAPERKTFGAFFLPIDRVFSKKGFGSVVTGTSLRGTAGEGDEVEIMPGGATGRIRSLQTHGEKSSGARPGQRLAINLSGVSQDDMERGDAVCARGAFVSTECSGAWIDVLPSAPGGIAHWQRLRIHVGTADVVARVSLLRLDSESNKRAYPPGGGGPAQIIFERPVALAAGQRFVARMYSPLVTIGGGIILLPNSRTARSRAEREAKAETLRLLAGDFGPEAFLAALVRDAGIAGAQELQRLSQMDRQGFSGAIAELCAQAKARDIVTFGKAPVFASAEAFAAIARAARGILEKFHGKHPELAGLDAEKLYPALGAVKGAGKIAAGDWRDLVALMARKGLVAQAEAGELAQGKTFFCAAGFRSAPDDKFAALAARVRDDIEAAGYALPTQAEIEARLGISAAEARRATAFLREREDLRVIDGGLFLSRKTRDKLLAAIAAMREDITVASLRDSIGASRKYTMPMLEFLDSQGLTQRIGDKRILAGKTE